MLLELYFIVLLPKVLVDSSLSHIILCLEGIFFIIIPLLQGYAVFDMLFL